MEKRWTAFDWALVWSVTDWLMLAAILYVVVAVIASQHQINLHDIPA